METKQCTKCGQIKNRELDFYHTKRTRSGKTTIKIQSSCKACQKADYRERYKNDPKLRANITKSAITYKRNRLEIDVFFKMKHNLRSLIGQSITKKGYTKNSRTYEILGCSYEEFKTHIESQFVDGMNWDNHGDWHYDHIKPISLANTEVELIALNHYTNFQPLWAEDNLRKSNKY